MKKEEGKKLGELFLGIKMTKADFARTFKVPGGPSMISQHISGNRPISMEAAIAYAQGFGCPIEEFSPRLADEAKIVARAVDSDVAEDASTSGISVEQDRSYTISVLNAFGSMGEGVYSNEDDLAIDLIQLKKTWVDEYIKPLSAPKNLYFIHALGDSMTPTLNHGDIVLIDTGIKYAYVDGVYVLRAHQRLFIKRVRTRLDGAHEISSDNPNVKTVDVLNGDHEVEILGRVVWVWNGRRV